MPGVLQVLKSLQVGRGLSLERIGDTSCISSNFFRYGIPNRENAPIKLGMSLCSSTAPAASSMRSNQHHCYQSHALRRHHHSSPSPPDTIMTWWIGLGFGGGGRGPSPILFDFCTSLSSVQTVGRWRVFFHNLFFLFFSFSFPFFSFCPFCVSDGHHFPFWRKCWSFCQYPPCYIVWTWTGLDRLDIHHSSYWLMSQLV